MAEISLCAIVLNEVEALETAVPLWRSCGSQVVVVDTGSSDGTLAALIRAGVEVTLFDWVDDFGAARNRALDEAWGDWILVLDADERLDADDLDRIPELVESAPEDIGGFVFDVRNYTDDWGCSGWCPLPADERARRGATGYLPTEVVRLFRNDRRVRYRGRVHELVEPALRACGLRLARAGITIHHPLTSRRGQDSRGKRSLYRRLLEAKVAEEPDSAKAHWELGELLLADGRPDLAARSLRRALELAPTDSRVLASLARALRGGGRAEAALVLLERLRDESLQRGDAGADDAGALDVEIALAAVESGDATCARDACRRALVAGSPSPLCRYWLARLTAEEDPDSALELVEQVASAAPELWPARLLAAELQLAVGAAERASVHYRAALDAGVRTRSADPDGDEFTELGGGLVARIAARPEAMEVLRRAARGAPPTAVWLHARALLAGGAPTEARATLAALVRAADGELDPLLRRRARYLLAQAHGAERRWGEAAQMLELVLGEDPDHVGALVDLAGLHGNSGRIELAQELLTRAAALDPENPLVHGNLALAAVRRHPPRLAEARRALARARELGFAADPRLVAAIEGAPADAAVE